MGFLLLHPTLVSEQAFMLKLWNRCIKAILISSWASLIPTQLRGPAPNGRYTNGCRVALASGVNLENNSMFVFKEEWKALENKGNPMHGSVPVPKIFYSV